MSSKSKTEQEKKKTGEEPEKATSSEEKNKGWWARRSLRMKILITLGAMLTLGFLAFTGAGIIAAIVTASSVLLVSSLYTLFKTKAETRSMWLQLIGIALFSAEAIGLPLLIAAAPALLFAAPFALPIALGIGVLTLGVSMLIPPRTKWENLNNRQRNVYLLTLGLMLAATVVAIAMLVSPVGLFGLGILGFVALGAAVTGLPLFFRRIWDNPRIAGMVSAGAVLAAAAIFFFFASNPVGLIAFASITLAATLFAAAFPTLFKKLTQGLWNKLFPSKSDKKEEAAEETSKEAVKNKQEQEVENLGEMKNKPRSDDFDNDNAAAPALTEEEREDLSLDADFLVTKNLDNHERMAEELSTFYQQSSEGRSVSDQKRIRHLIRQAASEQLESKSELSSVMQKFSAHQAQAEVAAARVTPVPPRPSAAVSTANSRVVNQEQEKFRSDLAKELKKNLGNKKFTLEIDKSSAQNSAASNKQTTALGIDGKSADHPKLIYTRTFKRRTTGEIITHTVTYDPKTNTIHVDRNSADSIKMALEIAKARGSKAVRVPDDLTDVQKRRFTRLCEQTGLELHDIHGKKLKIPAPALKQEMAMEMAAPVIPAAVANVKPTDPPDIFSNTKAVQNPAAFAELSEEEREIEELRQFEKRQLDAENKTEESLFGTGKANESVEEAENFLFGEDKEELKEPDLATAGISPKNPAVEELHASVNEEVDKMAAQKITDFNAAQVARQKSGEDSWEEEEKAQKEEDLLDPNKPLFEAEPAEVDKNPLLTGFAAENALLEEFKKAAEKEVEENLAAQAGIKEEVTTESQASSKIQELAAEEATKAAEPVVAQPVKEVVESQVEAVTTDQKEQVQVVEVTSEPNISPTPQSSKAMLGLSAQPTTELKGFGSKVDPPTENQESKNAPALDLKRNGAQASENSETKTKVPATDLKGANTGNTTAKAEDKKGDGSTVVIAKKIEIICAPQTWHTDAIHKRDEKEKSQPQQSQPQYQTPKNSFHN